MFLDSRMLAHIVRTNAICVINFSWTFFTFTDKAKSDNSTKTKTYWISTHFRTFWHAAKSFCHSFGMELLSLDTLEEAQKFMNICVTNKLFVDRCFHIGGLTTVPSSKTEWFWVNSFKKVKYEMPWLPKEPNYLGKNEMCLSICKNPGQCGYNDIPCSSSAELTFVCQSRN